MFKSSVNLFKIWGIPVGLHWSWFVVFVLVTMALAGAILPRDHPGLTTGGYLLLGTLTSLLFFASVVLHELGHTYAARLYGVPVREITLFIFGGAAVMTKEPPTARAEFWIALAGPLVSVALAVMFGALWLAAGEAAALAAPVYWLAWINFTLAVFNLIPGYPLDGGRVLRAIVWHIKGNLTQATRVASKSGKFVALGFIAFGVYTLLGGNLLGGLWIGLIGWFLMSSAAATLAYANLEERLRDVTAGAVMSRRIPTVDESLSLQRLVDEHLLRGENRCFFVTAEGRPRGLITLTDVTRIPREDWPRLTVGETMTPRESIVAVAPETGLLEALQQISEKNVAQVPVVAGGLLLGVLTREAVFRQIDMRRQLDITTSAAADRAAPLAPRLDKPVAGPLS